MQQDDLNHLRHSTAHLLAAAVLELYPNTKPTIGPAIDSGFYYDFDFGEVKLSETDLPKIEQKMHEIVKTWDKFERIEVAQETAIKQFSKNEYKKELIDELVKTNEQISFYKSGNFTDLCRGGHTDSPNKELKHFKLLSIAGAYWRGSEKNKMLTRIYGTAFSTKKELDDYLTQQEEAKKRDHRKIGKEQELFLISQEVGSGFPIYMPKGFLLRRALEAWLTKEKEQRGYKFVWTPHLGKSDLYKKSGHWQKYDAMFNPMKLDEEEYVVKPMNCPHHFQIYLERPRSYKELPLRIAENATVYRYEKAGELNGLLRVRALTQDDSHIIVRHDQIADEINNILELTFKVYKTFGFSNYRARISVRDRNHPEKYLGKPETWDKAEKALIDAVKKHNIGYFVGEGEAAFYGPKIDLMVKDAIGREWQLTTCQLDFVQPENFNMNYINEEGKEERPAVLHVAVLGSVDRFLGILIEHYAGNFPTWLAPIQVKTLPIADRHLDYANKVAGELRKANIRAEVDERSERLSAKIRDAQLNKVNYMLIVGDKEEEANLVSQRGRSGKDYGQVKLEEFITNIKQEIDEKLLI